MTHPPSIAPPGIHQTWLTIILASILATGILFPSILYGILLKPRSAADVLIASGICLFSSLVYLWTLHAISAISLRDSWMSKAIFSAAIAGILGASVAIYRNFGENTFPLEGEWEFHLEREVAGNINCVWAGSIIIVNSPTRNAYIGLAGDNRESNDSCSYGVKDIKAIEWNDREKQFGFYVVNFSQNERHLPENAAPTSTLKFKLKQDGNDWIGEASDPKSNSTPFRISLHRL